MQDVYMFRYYQGEIGGVYMVLADHRDGCRVQVFLAWSSITQSVCQRAFSLLAIWCLGPRVQILHSAEEHNLSPFDLNIACLCQSIEINNNIYIYIYIYIDKPVVKDYTVVWCSDMALSQGSAVFIYDLRWYVFCDMNAMYSLCGAYFLGAA